MINMQYRQLKLWLFSALTLILLSVSVSSFAKSVKVQTDRQSVEMGDIITLIVEADFQTYAGQIDLTKLSDQFKVISHQQSNQVELINNEYRSFTQWRILMSPKQEGLLIIPTLSIDGIESEPYPINVSKAEYAKGKAPYFFQVKVDQPSVYIQQQFIYTLRFFHQGNLINGNIREPQFENALTEKLKEQSTYAKTINGLAYTVYEWQYAVFPQSSGKLTILGPTFTGILQINSAQKEAKAIAEPLIIEVKAQPNESNSISQYWLPAQNLTLKEHWDKTPETIHIGDSLMRTITIEVNGLKPSQLPEFTFKNGDNFKIYPEGKQPEQLINEKGVKSQITYSQAIIPTKEGQIQLPEFKIQWWNTETQRMQTTVLESKPLNVWPSNPAIPPILASNDTAKSNASTIEQTINSTINTKNSEQINSVWFYISLIMMVFVVILGWTMYQLKIQIRELQNKPQTNENSHEMNAEPTTNKLNKSWCEQPPKECYRQLLVVLKNNLNINTIEEINNIKLRQNVIQLEAHLFANEPLGKQTLQTIYSQLNQLIEEQNQTLKANQKSQLTPLYRKANT